MKRYIVSISLLAEHKKISAIKLFREISKAHLGLREAKDIVDKFYFHDHYESMSEYLDFMVDEKQFVMLAENMLGSESPCIKMRIVKVLDDNYRVTHDFTL